MSHNIFDHLTPSVYALVFIICCVPSSAAADKTTLEDGDDHTKVSASAGVRIGTEADSERDEEKIESPRIRFRAGRGRVTFLYEDEGYVSVSVAGDFNDWDAEPMKLDSLDGVWRYRVTLEPGRYLYRFVVRDADGEWEAIDLHNADAVRDSERGWVSVFRIRSERPWRSSRRDRNRFVRKELDGLYGDEDFGLDYQRVDGLFIYLAPGAYARRSYGTSIKGKVGYGFKSEEWSASATLAQPLLHDGRLLVMLSGYSETSYTDQTGVGDLENTLAAVFFKDDFRDYYLREGFCARLVLNAHRHFRVAAGYRVDDYSSLENNASWSMGKGDFIVNPPVQEGTMRSLFSEMQIGSDLTHLRVYYETSGDHLAGGDYEFDQLTAQVRHRFDLGPSQCLDTRVKYGTTLAGTLPNQRRYLAGGLGTVRGYNYQSLLIDPFDDAGFHGGQQLFLANAEFKFGFGLGWIDIDHDDWDWDWDWDWDRDFDFDIAVFADAGMVWADKDADIDFNQLKSSAGVGFLFGGDDGFRIDIIRVLDGSEKGFSGQIRINRMF